MKKSPNNKRVKTNIIGGKIEVESIGENTEKYNGNLMSDGERDRKSVV